MALPVACTDVERASRQDRTISKVLQYTQRGWPQIIPEPFKPFYSRRDELSTEAGFLLWGTRVIIPSKLQETVLSELHQGHPGVSAMKSIARSYLWWPNLDKDLETTARSCLSCQAVKQSPAATPLHPWVWPARPWQRVHVDFAGPFMGKMFLLAVDAHSKWGEVYPMLKTTTSKTIELLQHMFAASRLPEQLVSDNGPQFVSEEFRQFTRGNGIKHIRSSPYHPASNGLAERFVRTFKESMKAMKNENLSLNQKLVGCYVWLCSLD